MHCFISVSVLLSLSISLPHTPTPTHTCPLPTGGALLGGCAALYQRALLAGGCCNCVCVCGLLSVCGPSLAHACSDLGQKYAGPTHCSFLGPLSLATRWRLCMRVLVPFSQHLRWWLTTVRPSTAPSLCPQRDCEVEVTSVDRAGNFQGTVRFGKMNLGGESVREGRQRRELVLCFLLVGAQCLLLPWAAPVRVPIVL
jgi:hypothetical protein